MSFILYYDIGNYATISKKISLLQAFSLSDGYHKRQKKPFFRVYTFLSIFFTKPLLINVLNSHKLQIM